MHVYAKSEIVWMYDDVQKNVINIYSFILAFVVQGIILKAWIDVTSGKDAYAKKAGKYFDEGLKEKADAFALMGKVRWQLNSIKLILPF